MVLWEKSNAMEYRDRRPLSYFFLIRRKVALRSVSVLSGQTIWTGTRDTPPPCYRLKLWIPETFSITEVIHQKTFRWNETTVPTEDLDTPTPCPPFIHIFFDTGSFLKHRRVPLQKSSVTLRHNNFDGNSW